MKTVGLRELKNRLSEYVRHVRNGETVTVTDRGEVVAELVPPRRSQDQATSGLEELARRGEVRLAKSSTRSERVKIYTEQPRALKGITVVELLNEDRGER
ncbi:MAG: type II toxin-antitoxin system prevent-host-death family antitoxin [Rhizomicrobium sp.]|jgi:prevent-host-death family protein